MLNKSEVLQIQKLEVKLYQYKSRKYLTPMLTKSEYLTPMLTKSEVELLPAPGTP
jgi:hypothetical protein